MGSVMGEEAKVDDQNIVLLSGEVKVELKGVEMGEVVLGSERGVY